MRYRTHIVGALVLVCLLAGSVMSHHSNSAYQVDVIITLEGIVTEWQWSNPHTWLYMTVTNEHGQGSGPELDTGAARSSPGGLIT